MEKSASFNAKSGIDTIIVDNKAKLSICKRKFYPWSNRAILCLVKLWHGFLHLSKPLLV